MSAKVPNGITRHIKGAVPLYCTLDEAASMLSSDQAAASKLVRELVRDGYLTELPGRTGSSPVQVLLSDVLTMRTRLQPRPTETDLTRPGFLGTPCRRPADHRPHWRTKDFGKTWSTATCTACKHTWRTKAPYVDFLPLAHQDTT